MLAILSTSATAFSIGGGAPARGTSARVQRHAAVTSLDFLSKCETSLSCALRLRGGGACVHMLMHTHCVLLHSRALAWRKHTHGTRCMPNSARS
jgi:hypothetical protein